MEELEDDKTSFIFVIISIAIAGSFDLFEIVLSIDIRYSYN